MPTATKTPSPTTSPAPGFQMPPAMIGQQVAYYPTGRREEAYKLAQIWKVQPSRTAVFIHRADGTPADESIRHVDDPILERSDELRMRGAWDYLPHERYALEAIARLDEEVARLREEIKALSAAGGAEGKAKGK